EALTAPRAELETLIKDLGDEAFPSLPPRMQRHLLRRAGWWQRAHSGAVERDAILHARPVTLCCHRSRHRHPRTNSQATRRSTMSEQSTMSPKSELPASTRVTIRLEPMAEAVLRGLPDEVLNTYLRGVQARSDDLWDLVEVREQDIMEAREDAE